MSKSFAATRRDLHEYCKDLTFEEQHTADWKLTRHPYSKKKHKWNMSEWHAGHMFGSVKHMDRKAYHKDKQRCRQADRHMRKQETIELIKQYNEEAQ